jgi:hypothetical protein
MLRRLLVATLLVVGGSAMVGCGVKDQNQALLELSQLFFADSEKPTFGRELLDPSRLDFSIDSLKHVDEYLESIRAAKGIDANWNTVVLRAGAYVGEVIRRNSAHTQWRWLDYDTARSLNPKSFDELGKNIGTAAVLYNGSGFTFPLGKVAKRLKNGSEDSVFLYAEVILSPERDQAATR